MRKRRTEIVVEIDEVLVIRSRQAATFAWCTECSDQERTLTLGQAATIADVSRRVISRWIEAGRIHLGETGKGDLLICESSLVRLIERGDDVDA